MLVNVNKTMFFLVLVSSNGRIIVNDRRISPKTYSIFKTLNPIRGKEELLFHFVVVHLLSVLISFNLKRG